MDWLSELLTGDLLPPWAVLLLILVLMAVPLGPAEPTALAAGFLIGASALPSALTVTVVAAGMTAGDVVAHRAGGLVLRRARTDPRRARRLDRWEQTMRAHPVRRDLAVIGLRFLPGARTPSALAAGAAGVSTGRFILLAAGGSLLWAVSWTMLWAAGAGAVVQSAPSGLLAGGMAALFLVMFIAPVFFRLLRERVRSPGGAVGLHDELIGRRGLHRSDEAPGVRP